MASLTAVEPVDFDGVAAEAARIGGALGQQLTLAASRAGVFVRKATTAEKKPVFLIFNSEGVTALVGGMHPSDRNAYVYRGQIAAGKNQGITWVSKQTASPDPRPIRALVSHLRKPGERQLTKNQAKRAVQALRSTPTDTRLREKLTAAFGADFKPQEGRELFSAIQSYSGPPQSEAVNGARSVSSASAGQVDAARRGAAEKGEVLFATYKRQTELALNSIFGQGYSDWVDTLGLTGRIRPHDAADALLRLTTSVWSVFRDLREDRLQPSIFGRPDWQSVTARDMYDLALKRLNDDALDYGAVTPAMLEDPAWKSAPIKINDPQHGPTTLAPENISSFAKRSAIGISLAHGLRIQAPVFAPNEYAEDVERMGFARQIRDAAVMVADAAPEGRQAATDAGLIDSAYRLFRGQDLPANASQALLAVTSAAGVAVASPAVSEPHTTRAQLEQKLRKGEIAGYAAVGPGFITFHLRPISEIAAEINAKIKNHQLDALGASSLSRLKEMVGPPDAPGALLEQRLKSEGRWQFGRELASEVITIGALGVVSGGVGAFVEGAGVGLTGLSSAATAAQVSKGTITAIRASRFVANSATFTTALGLTQGELDPVRYPADMLMFYCLGQAGRFAQFLARARPAQGLPKLVQQGIGHGLAIGSASTTMTLFAAGEQALRGHSPTWDESWQQFGRNLLLTTVLHGVNSGLARVKPDLIADAQLRKVAMDLQMRGEQETLKLAEKLEALSASLNDAAHLPPGSERRNEIAKRVETLMSEVNSQRVAVKNLTTSYLHFVGTAFPAEASAQKVAELESMLRELDSQAAEKSKPATSAAEAPRRVASEKVPEKEKKVAARTEGVGDAKPPNEPDDSTRGKKSKASSGLAPSPSGDTFHPQAKPATLDRVISPRADQRYLLRISYDGETYPVALRFTPELASALERNGYRVDLLTAELIDATGGRSPIYKSPFPKPSGIRSQGWLMNDAEGKVFGFPQELILDVEGSAIHLSWEKGLQPLAGLEIGENVGANDGGRKPLESKDFGARSVVEFSSGGEPRIKDAVQVDLRQPESKDKLASLKNGSIDVAVFDQFPDLKLLEQLHRVLSSRGRVYVHSDKSVSVTDEMIEALGFEVPRLNGPMLTRFARSEDDAQRFSSVFKKRDPGWKGYVNPPEWAHEAIQDAADGRPLFDVIFNPQSREALVPQAQDALESTLKRFNFLLKGFEELHDGLSPKELRRLLTAYVNAKGAIAIPSAKILPDPFPFGELEQNQVDATGAQRLTFLFSTRYRGYRYSLGMGLETRDGKYVVHRPYVFVDRKIAELVDRYDPQLFINLQNVTSLSSHDLTGHAVANNEIGDSSWMERNKMMQGEGFPRKGSIVPNNYEYMLLKMHAQLWKHHFATDKGAKTKKRMLEQAKEYVRRVEDFANRYQSDTGKSGKDIAEYLLKIYFEENLFFMISPMGGDFEWLFNSYPNLKSPDGLSAHIHGSNAYSPEEIRRVLKDALQSMYGEGTVGRPPN